MGGYGALKCAFGSPDVFSACGAFSSAYNIRHTAQNYKEIEGIGEIGYHLGGEMVALFGEERQAPDDSDVFMLAEKTASTPLKPKLYMSCGTEDRLITINRQLRDQINALPIDYKYEEWSGIHDWIFWNESLRRMLAHFL
jgi:S-formylglutathione hydrolase FrmB